ncbi:MAG: dienelactone hydrolase family protein [Alphaproteobacteria bacterium]|nr:dienelactone hydrolase family protein [Alphaproteobacteria bacterium]MCL2504697.1 dienelactone hydrolase family protein [Alphaproteobacteria bacterium]
MNKTTSSLVIFCAAIISVAGLFLFLDVDYMVLKFAVIIAAVLLLNLMLSGLGKFINQKCSIKPWVNRVGSGMLTVLSLLVMLYGTAYVVQDRMFFLNIHDEESREFLQGRPGFHEVKFTDANGITRHGMMRKVSDEPAPLVIYFGGNAEVSYRNLRNHEELGQWQYFPGYHYLFVDYEGYGINDGRNHYLKMYEHALAVYDWVVTLPGVDTSRIVAMGYSLGTGSAVYLAAHRPVAGLILAAPYANGFDLYNNAFPIFKGPMRRIVRQRLPSDEFAPKVTSPVLIIASRRDEIVPFSSSEQLSGLFKSDVDFMVLNNVPHNAVFQAEGVFDKIRSFLVKIAS